LLLCNAKPHHDLKDPKRYGTEQPHCQPIDSLEHISTPFARHNFRKHGRRSLVCIVPRQTAAVKIEPLVTFLPSSPFFERSCNISRKNKQAGTIARLLILIDKYVPM
jgi:hypothetical protein